MAWSRLRPSPDPKTRRRRRPKAYRLEAGSIKLSTTLVLAPMWRGIRLMPCHTHCICSVQSQLCAQPRPRRIHATNEPTAARLASSWPFPTTTDDLSPLPPARATSARDRSRAGRPRRGVAWRPERRCPNSCNSESDHVKLTVAVSPCLAACTPLPCAHMPINCPARRR